MKLRAAFALSIVALACFVPGGEAQTSTEAALMAKINGVRNVQLSTHPALLAIARQHSKEMAANGDLEHGNAGSRIGASAGEGYTGTWCENLAFTSNRPDVATFIFQQWQNSPGHNACMNDERMNTGAVGLYYDSTQDEWWATFDAIHDTSPPGSAPVPTPVPPTPVRTSTPVPVTITNRPAATQRPAASAAGRTPTPRPAGFGDDPTASPSPSGVPTPTATTSTTPGEIAVGFASPEPDGGGAGAVLPVLLGASAVLAAGSVVLYRRVR